MRAASSACQLADLPARDNGDAGVTTFHPALEHQELRDAHVAGAQAPAAVYEAPADPLTAPASAIRRRRAGAPVRLAHVAREFVRRDSPRLIAGALALALAARLAALEFSWRDLVLPLALIVCEPLTEWMLHSCLLHAKPIRIAGRSHELLAAREHRAHHAAPAELDGVLVPAYAVLLFLPLIAAVLYALSLPLHSLIGGDRPAWLVSGVIAAYAILLAYEWCHFLIHSPYRPRGRYYKAIWRNHRLHHYKSERYWFGVTSHLGDVLLGTNPAQAAVPKSPTARALAR
jgi:hypothetical protein